MSFEFLRRLLLSKCFLITVTCNQTCFVNIHYAAPGGGGGVPDAAFKNRILKLICDHFVATDLSITCQFVKYDVFLSVTQAYSD